MAESKKEWGGLPLLSGCCVLHCSGCHCSAEGPHHPLFSISLAHTSPPPSLCAVETPGHCSWGKQAISPMDYMLTGIAAVSVIGNFGLELFLAALSVSQRQDYEVKLSD